VTVYVDVLNDYGWVMYGRVTKSCHMFADTEAELHAMAAKVGMKLSWFQPWKGRSVPHYDLVPSRRAAAVKYGAKEVGREEAIGIWKRLRAEAGKSDVADAGPAHDGVVVSRLGTKTARGPAQPGGAGEAPVGPVGDSGEVRVPPPVQPPDPQGDLFGGQPGR